MAGTYTKKEFGAGPEEQTLLKDVNGARILPSKGSEPVRLSPGWEGTGRPDDELNFKDMTMDQVNLESNPPKDRFKIVYLVMILHGVGTLISWNMFITAYDYFNDYKLNNNATGQLMKKNYPDYQENSALAAQIPNLIFSWVNLFAQLGGNLTIRIVWGIFVQIIVFVFTVVLAMLDTINWVDEFFWATMVSIVIINIANGIYQNSVFGMAAKLPGKYTGAVVLGANISGTFVAIIKLVSHILSPDPRTAAIYYFITALFVLLACFDTYFALPINRFYRYHELLAQKAEKKASGSLAKEKNLITHYWKIFEQCWGQCFNVFFVFFVTLTLFPGVQMNIKKFDSNFPVPEDYYADVMCFLVFNVTAMFGSLFGSWFQWPSKRYVFLPILLRAAFIPLFLLCNYQIKNEMRVLPVLIENDWIFLTIAVVMGITSGYFSSITMMYCPSSVEAKHAPTAGMFAAASLISGIVAGLTFTKVMPHLVKLSF